MPDQFLNQLLNLPTVVTARLSPDGRWVAFTWYRIHENTDIFVVPVSGLQPPVALTHTPEATRLVGWTVDSRAVIVAEDHCRNERDRLFRVDLDRPGEMRPLTEPDPPYFIRGGELSPDGAYLYYGANYDFARRQVIGPTWIYRHNLASGERMPLGMPCNPAYTAPEMNAAGTHLIYARKDRHPAGRQYHLVDIDRQMDEEFLNAGDQAKVFARWFPDGEHILVLAEALGEHGQSIYNRLGVYHWPTARLRWLIDDPRRAIEGSWVSPDGCIIVDEVVRASRAPSFIPPPFSKEQPFPRLDGNLLVLGAAAGGGWVAMHYAATSPVELVRFSLDARAPADLASITRVWDHTALRPQQLVPAESLTWLAPDGLLIQGWLYRAQPNPRRAVLFLHGGPTHHSEDRLNPQIQYLVSQGFNVLDINYRGSSGFGLPFREAIKVDGWGGREQEDIAAGARALISAGLAEPGRVGVTGTSYGGYCAWCQITHQPPEVIAAAAPVCGMTDLVVDYETTRPDLRPLSEEMLGGSPIQVPERYFERSPINFVHHIRGCLLIVQGAQDPNVTPANVRQVRARLEANHIPYELLVFEDEGHGISKPANQQELYRRLAQFFDAALSKNHPVKSQP